ncbi:MAG: hypothetical protein CR991_03995 [Proteobacteria bacterium]|nr:MAG: hypothetical protein CR991_03995 [Pseudomonadota bacterium]
MKKSPINIALERIEECHRSRSALTALDLSGLGLDTIPEEVFDLTWLEALDCNHNQISDLSGLRHLPQLRVLNCSGNQVSDLSALRHVPQLQTLDCLSNQISDLSVLRHVPQLQTLDCSSNPISDLSALRHVPQLQTLYYNHISDLSALRHMPLLQALHCNFNQINDLSALSHVPQLQTLNCGGNQINDLNALRHVPQLQTLGCSYNQISDLSALRHVPQLQTLDCNHNQINDLAPIYDLVISGQLQTLYLHANPIAGIPPIILGNNYNNCSESLRNYWLDLVEGASKQQQFKVQLIGNGRVGKTTLAYALKHKQPPNEAFEETHGIVLDEIQQTLDGEEQPITLQLWDFGGQEIYHATHRLFLSDDCLYLLVWAEATEEHPDEAQHPVSYWLELIHDLGKNSPIILVKNQIDRADQLPTRPPQLTADMPGVAQIRQEVKISAKKDQGMPALRGAIESILEELKPRICLELPNSWLQVQAQLKQLKQETLPFAHFEQLCVQAGVSDPAWFVKYLHNTGVLFYHRDAFQDQIILDQNWIITAVYRVFDPKGCRKSIENQQGRFDGHFTSFIWPEAGAVERQIYLNFMRNCGICYEPHYRENYLSGTSFAEREFIIPALLPQKSKIEAAWTHQADDWRLVIEYPFLHRSIIERLILRLGETYDSEAWRMGIFCETEFGKVLLNCQHTQPDGETSHAGQLQFQLRAQQAMSLVQVLRKLVKETSPHPRYQEFLQQGQQAELEKLPPLNEEDHAPHSRLNVIKPQKNIKLFISYSRVDHTHKLTLEKHLRLIQSDLLKQGIELDVWSDKRMLAGDPVNEQILPKLRHADMIVLLVSPDFLDPERYSCRVELPIALERHEKADVPVIPVLVRHTENWYKNLGHLTVATQENTKALEDWPSKDKFWGSVQRGIHKQLESLGTT